MKPILTGFLILLFSSLPFAGTIPVYTEANTTITQGSDQPVFVIQLKSNRTTGYSWSLGPYDKQYIQMVHYQYLPPIEMIAGASGAEQWTFQLTKTAFLAPKTLSIALTYNRPWENKGDSTKMVFQVSTIKGHHKIMEK